MSKKLIITGGAGFIGINATRFFLKKNFEITILDNFSRKGTRENINRLIKDINNKYRINVIKVDIKNFDKLSKVIKKIKPEIILHLAAQVAVTKSVINPRYDFENNILASFNLLESCRLYSKKSLLIYSSTNKVYGKIDLKETENKLRYNFNKNQAIDENQQLDFYSPYGCSKGSADQYFHDYSRIYGLKTVVLRQSCIFGENQFGVEDQGWVAWFIIAFLLKKNVTIYGNGKQIRDLLYVDDLVNLFYQIYLNKNKCSGEVFNVGGGFKNTLSLNELIKILKQKYNLNTKIKFGEKRLGDQNIFVSNNKKIIKFTKWKPSTSCQSGIKKVFDWSKDNLAIIKKII